MQAGACAPKWKNVIPKGQFIGIQRNYDRISNCLEQSNILIQRLVDKGNQRYKLKEVQQHIGGMDRDTLLTGKQKKGKNQEWAFIIDFNQQCKEIPHWSRHYLGDHNLSIQRPQT